MRLICTTFSDGKREIMEISDDGNQVNYKSSRRQGAAKVRRIVSEVELVFDKSKASKKAVLDAMKELERIVGTGSAEPASSRKG